MKKAIEILDKTMQVYNPDWSKEDRIITAMEDYKNQFDGIAFLLPPTDPFDAFEIHPVKDITRDGDEGTHFEQCEEQEAELWSVYVHYIPSDRVVGVECIADCKTKEQAETLVDTLQKLCKLYNPLP